MARDYSQSGDSPQLELPFGPLYNRNLFSNHWLDRRLPLEPEWCERRADAEVALQRLVELWEEERDRVQRYENEQSLEYAFIQKVFQALGWQLIYQTYVRRRKPDYALFLSKHALDSALQLGKRSPDFWQCPAVLADAKDWRISLDRPTIVNSQREYPPEQIEWYLTNTQLDYAILTNGQTWRLIPRVHDRDQPRFQTYLECHLPALIDSWRDSGLFEREAVFSSFLKFFLFLGPAAFQSVEGRDPLVRRARQGSSEYRLGIGEDLKPRVFEALRLAIEGFIRFDGNQLDQQADLATCREQAFVLLYRLLFILYAEDRRLLPYRVNRYYTDNRSLGRIRDDIATTLDRAGRQGTRDYSRSQTAIWGDLLLLFDLVDSGRAMYGVPAYNGGLFNPAQNGFLAEKCMSDWYMARVIDELGRAYDTQHPGSGLYRVDYHDLQIQHLGNVYEGLLELHSHVASVPMIVIRPTSAAKRGEEKTIKASESLPLAHERTGVCYEQGDVYLLNDKGERRATGSYYTPDHIVRHIIEGTIDPICRELALQLKEEVMVTEARLSEVEAGPEKAKIESELELLRTSYDSRLLRLRVLDPAMGSGHFLLRACQHLAEDIATHPYTSSIDIEDSSSSGEPTITFWKRRVVERCLYGVDKNRLAVELAKLALWLETVSVDRPLTFLDHHLRHGNSLVGAKTGDLESLPGSGELFQDAFTAPMIEKLPALLHALHEIRDTPSDTSSQVRSKGTTYRNRLERVRTPFRQIADLWCSVFFLREGQVNDSQYKEALDTLGRPRKFKELTGEGWFRAAIARAGDPDTTFFHWELEFPEVFLASAGTPGFDAVIGNPPYDVLDKEFGCDLDGLKLFLKRQAIYDPSHRGKNNLYKLFICRALDLLAEGGRLGFIVPMPLLGDDQAADLRREVLRQGAFTAIDGFPQKDDPKQRVFPEAKLSTTAFALRKTADEQLKATPFFSRVHSAGMVEASSPGLQLTTDEIPLYDESNCTIVCCSQEDWDLATQIMRSGRMQRLGQVCEQFQGEVNQKTDAQFLSDDPTKGESVLRGSNVCLYVLREASQGESLYLDPSAFLDGKRAGSKCFHSRLWRVGFQRSSPQNNFRRLIAALVEPGHYCFDTVSYVPSSHTELPLEYLTALLNTRLLDWYFRLGSTNSKVNEYQFDNLPCPVFASALTPRCSRVLRDLDAATQAGQFDRAFEIASPLTDAPPFSVALRDFIAHMAATIVSVERERGEIKRHERSALAPEAQLYQDLIDRLVYKMAGLEEDEIGGLEERLSKML